MATCLGAGAGQSISISTSPRYTTLVGGFNQPQHAGMWPVGGWLAPLGPCGVGVADLEFLHPDHCTTLTPDQVDPEKVTEEVEKRGTESSGGADGEGRRRAP